MKILFICKGNVGRSQMAEAMLRGRVDGRHDVASAGTDVLAFEGERLSEHDGASEVLAVMSELGVDMSANVRKQVTPAMVAQADRVIVMNNDSTVPAFLLSSEKAVFWEVVDPFRFSRDATREIRDRIATLVSGLRLD